MKKASRKDPVESPHEIIDPDLNDRLLMSFVYDGAKTNGAATHIDSMNLFISRGISQITTDIFRVESTFANDRTNTEEDLSIKEISFSVTFPSVHLTRPEIASFKSGQARDMNPMTARRHNLSYAGNLLINVDYTATATRHDGTVIRRTGRVRDQRIKEFPVMLGSSVCHTAGKSVAELMVIGEDPNDKGGYFIINGLEWVVEALENTTNNMLHIYKNNRPDERTRGHIISKAGDAYENSYQIIFRFMKSGAITLEIMTVRTVTMIVPFYLIFRAFGMTADEDIVEQIVPGFRQKSDPVTKYLLDAIGTAMDIEDPKFRFEPTADPRDQATVSTKLAEAMQELRKPINNSDREALRYFNSTNMIVMDRFILPVYGTDPSSRVTKLRDIGRHINRLLLCHFDIVDESDRDSFRNKRMHGAGISLAKAFKTKFNKTVVKELRRRLTDRFRSVPFSNVAIEDTIHETISTHSNLGREMCKIIKSKPNKVPGRGAERVNRVSAQMLYWKNDMNVRSTMNTVNTPDNSSNSKSSERASEMRQVHETSQGFMCPAQSADSGTKVGINKQASATARICEASSSGVLKALLLADTEAVIPLDQLHGAASAQAIRIIVNGEWIGFVRHESRVRASRWLYERYRDLRREGKIHPHTTITQEIKVNEICFWVDVGRIIRPMIIVYNNAAEYEASRAGKRGGAGVTAVKPVPFRQWTRLTVQHCMDLYMGRTNMESLRRMGVIEYISAEEQIGVFIAPSIDVLRKRQTNYKWKYTHLEVKHAPYGLPILSSPLANCSQAMRNTMFTNHRKQSVGICNLNWWKRVDKGTALQHYNEYPIVSTVTDAIMNPNGYSTMVAVIHYDGWDQEDSVTVNQSSIDRGMFNCSHFSAETIELDRDENFGDVNYITTKDIKKANYSGLVNGLVKVGTIVNQGDVLVVKAYKLATPDGVYTHSDRSHVYRNTEPMYVEQVIEGRNADGVQIVKIKLRANRPLDVGEKLASREGNKGIVSCTEPSSNMPYFDSGEKPDIVISAQSITTRMAVNQVNEMNLGTVAAHHGVAVDGTMLMDFSPEKVIGEMRKLGYEYAGSRRLYNGFTGATMNSLCFAGICQYQRLNKFLNSDYYCVKTGPKSSLMGQPLEGKSRDGGLRLGEMEIWALAARGMSRFIKEKISDHSDGVTMYICRRCHHRAAYHAEYRLHLCRECGNRADIAAVATTRASSQSLATIEAQCVNVEFELEPFRLPVNA